MFILLHFLLFSHSWPLSLSHCLSLSLRPNHRHHHLATIKPKPKSLKSKLCDLFVSHSHGWSEPKPRPIQAETQGWSDPFKPKSMLTKRTNREWMRKEEVDQTHWSGLKRRGWRRGWSNPLKQRVNEEWERRKKEAETRERKTETNRDKREKIK